MQWKVQNSTILLLILSIISNASNARLEKVLIDNYFRVGSGQAFGQKRRRSPW